MAAGARSGDAPAADRAPCPACGRWIDLTLQADRAADRCPCGMEAVLVIRTERMLRWYWRDPASLPHRAAPLPHRGVRDARPVPAPPPQRAAPLQPRLFDEGEA